MDELRAALEKALGESRRAPAEPVDAVAVQRRARQVATAAIVSETPVRRWTHRLDRVLLHPLAGPLILAVVMFTMFQAVFAWSEAPIGWIESGMAALGELVAGALPDGMIRSLIVDGVIGGVGAVVVFLPQILILFLFILLLEGTGYMVRAAFLMDRLMSRAGLSGRAFIPLLSSFACAVPGIMATRTIDNEKDRLTTILVAPLMTCSARLPVYTLIIAAFIPDRTVGPGIGLQGAVLFGLYLAGIVGALVAALFLRKTVARGAKSFFMMELPKYQLPTIKDVALGLWQRALIFLKRAGGIILVTTVLLWALASFPQAKPGERGAGRSYRSSIPPESMTIERFVRDLDELVDLVRRRFGKEQVVLLGHSWGSAIGLVYAARHPAKVAAYVGIGQVADMPEGERLSYDFALEEARRRDHRGALKALRRIGPPPHTVDEMLTSRKWVERFGGAFHARLSTGRLIWAALRTDEANLIDLMKFGQGNRFSLRHLWSEFRAFDIDDTLTAFETPLIFMLGRYDWQVPSVLAANYFERIDAPYKRLVWFEQSAHNPPFEEPERFSEALLEALTPVLLLK
jgi:pimeloyl-ACP methyl ester carboxylesterase